jgi:hypothetical protein
VQGDGFGAVDRLMNDEGHGTSQTRTIFGWALGPSSNCHELRHE